MIDVDERRALVLGMHPLENVDRAYRFHYDETNNVRKLHVRHGALNVEAVEPFVLGGIVEAAPGPTLDIADLRDALRLQANVSDIKLRHLASGGFLQLLDSKRVAAFLEWITERGLLVHFQVVDLLYWTIVDIVDSILAQADEAPFFQFHLAYKDSLLSLLRADQSATIALFARFEYPNVGERHREFLDEILDMLEQDESLEHFPRYMLKGILQLGRNADRLPFLADETPNLLVNGFGPFALERLCLFKQSEHILDEEPVIRAYLEAHPLTEGGRPFLNHRFANSASQPGIQVADIVAGLLGKAFSYIGRTELKELDADLLGMSPGQRASLARLSALLDRSTDQCSGFAHFLIPPGDRFKTSNLLGI
jgi:hypothetical protein